MTTLTDEHRSDFNVAGGSGSFGDILWRNHAGDYVLWLMNSNTPSTVATLPAVTPDWHLKAAADFDPFIGGNLNADILWQNDNGALALWQMNGTTVSAVHALPNPGPTWHVVGDNDFNANGTDDIFFQHDNGALAIWTITSAAMPSISGMFAGTQNPGPTWHVVGSGDIDADGRAGILWQNNNGALVLWENPTLAAGTFTFNTVIPLPTVDPSWHVKGMADLSGSVTADIVFQNDNGAVAIWEMGLGPGSTNPILAMNLVNLGTDWGPAWHVVGLRDMNNDARADVLLQNDNGAAAVWEDYTPYATGLATFLSFAITPSPNPNGHVWDLL